MKNIKDITLSAFAVIGFYTIITAFTSTESNPAQQVVNGTPESHVWEMITPNNGNGATAYLYNKVTGEVRKHRTDKDYYIMPTLKR
jgi:hypothetical protein